MSNKSSYKYRVIDLVREDTILVSFSYSNIIKIWELLSYSPEGFEIIKPESYFLILDWLYDTLDTRLQKLSTLYRQGLFVIKWNLYLDYLYLLQRDDGLY